MIFGITMKIITRRIIYESFKFTSSNNELFNEFNQEEDINEAINFNVNKNNKQKPE